MNIEQLILNGQGSIVDVRTYEEFNAAHAEGAINIPLPEISQRIEELKSLPSPLILCCASGNRSGMAERFITQQGIECYNAGSWLDINYLQAKASQTN